MTARSVALGALPAALLVAAAWQPRAAADITRTEVMGRAKAYVYYPWRCSAANLTASCTSGYASAYVPGDQMGVAYDWGGFDSLFQFDQKIADGHGAGSEAFGEVYSCTTGVDCSGFVSRAWHTTSKYGTSTIPDISAAIAPAQLLAGDVLNKAGYHVALFSHLLASGEPVFYEAVGYNTHVNVTGGWSYVSDFTPRRYDQIVGTTVSDPVGTLTNPIVVDSFPYADSRDTSTATSDLLDGCAAAPGTNESGPEYVYEVRVSAPGQLTVSVSDDVGVDIDVHLSSSWSTSDCTARHDATFTAPVDCGTYYVIADTFRSSSGGDQVGPYDLTIALAPSGAGCGAGPPGYDPMGALGDPCAYPGSGPLPFCNPTLGAEVCLYSTGADPWSMCTRACSESADCAGIPGGGCCEDVGASELYCVTADLCSSPPPPDAGPPPSPPDAAPPGGADAAISPSADAAGDPGEADSGTGADEDAGGCRVASGESSLPLWLVPIGLWWVRRRRARQQGLRKDL